jgi:serine/threonine protein phosphatase PrpC
MNKIYNTLHKDLFKVNFDCQLSGSTLTTLIFDRNTVFCANAGDSRAVLYSHHYIRNGHPTTDENLISDTE